MSIISRSFHQQNYDIAIVGGGIVGLATAKEIITRQPQKSIVILEKEDSLGKFFLPGLSKFCMEIPEERSDRSRGNLVLEYGAMKYASL